MQLVFMQLVSVQSTYRFSWMVLGLSTAIALLPLTHPAIAMSQLAQSLSLEELLEDEAADAEANPTELLPATFDAPANPLLLPTQPGEVRITEAQPITLEQAIELSFRNNEDLQIALLELQRSQAALREAQADRLPNVNLNTSLTAQEGQSSNFDPTTGQVSGGSQINTTLSGGVEVSYDLYTGGRREASIRAAEERTRLAELEIERRREQLRLDATNDYYALQESVEAIRISQAFLVEAERNRSDAALREEVGVGTRFDVLRADVQVANARQELVQAQSNEQVNLRSLARRLNLPPNLNVTTVPVSIAGSWPLTLEESIVLAFQGRAELEQQLVQRTISEQERQIALSANIPQLGVFASYDVQNSFNRSTGFTDSLGVGARLQWNLYDGGAARARAEQRERDIEIAESQFADTRNGVRLEVEQAYFNLVANQDNIGTAELAVEQAREALELAQLRFDAGVGTQLDVLSATRE
ncbi:MAG: TolC family protein, partial [Cyanobacteria bacterium Co-bin13]|nr:TolC family protein [Cyanobacteria bacterium Co-bin13]